MTEILFTNAKLADGALSDIGVAGGRIASIAPAGGASDAARKVDIAGALLVPAFVEGHIHLDTSFYGDTWIPHKPCTNGFDVHERVAFQAENMAQAAPMAERARRQLELCVSNGSLQMRSHVMVDGSVGLKSLETILKVREEYRDIIDIQLVAFPQSGILKSPGTPELLDEAVAMGAELVGGLDPASFDRDLKGHLDVVFGAASASISTCTISARSAPSPSRRSAPARRRSACRAGWRSATPTASAISMRMPPAASARRSPPAASRS